MWRRSSCLFLLAGFVIAGASAAQLFEFRFPPNHVRNLAAMGVDLNDPVRLEGRLVSTPRETPYGPQFDVAVKRLESRGLAHDTEGKVRLRLQASEDAEVNASVDRLHLKFGDSIRTTARLRRPRIYENPGSFDFRRWMESIEDVYWVGTIKNPLLLEKLPEPSRGFRSFLERTHRRLIQGIDGLYPPWSARGRYGAVLKAVLWGDRSSLDSDTIENFRKTGLYHLLVIAGLHVGLLALLVAFFLRFLPLSRTVRSLLLLASLAIYALLVEQRAPTLRATIMIAIYLLARLLDRERSLLNAIGLAALLLLLYRPAWLFESGFQLSFSAALLIAGLAVPVLERTTEPYRRALWNLDDERMDDRLAPKLAQFRLELRALMTHIRARRGFLARHPSLTDVAVKVPVRLLVWTLNMLLFSSVLQLGLMLPMVETFHRVTYAGVVLNALAIPLMTLLLAIALPTAVLAAVAPGWAAWLAKPLAAVLAGLFAMTHLGGPRMPGWLSYRVPEPPAWVAWGFALSVIAAGLALGRLRPAPDGAGLHAAAPLPVAGQVSRPVSRRAWWPTDTWLRRTFWVAVACAGIFLILLSVHPFAPRLPAGGLEVTALDCGQGDALLVVFPDRTTMLVDAGLGRARGNPEGAFQGRRWDAGEDIVSPYLWSRGVKRIDVLALSHAHEDHLGGMPAIVENFQVGEFWHGANASTPEYLALLEQVRQRGIPARLVAAGEVRVRGGATVQVLWPPHDHRLSRAPSNDDSLVLRIAYGAASMLLPGDISQRVEGQLIASGAPLQSQVLKVSHHGSKSASGAEFITRVSPRLAVVSADYGGLANLPNPETIATLRAAGAQVLRTDLDGAITVELHGSWLGVHRYATFPGDSTAEAAITGAAGAGTFKVR
jgi:competence protein ComEC